MESLNCKSTVINIQKKTIGPLKQRAKELGKHLILKKHPQELISYFCRKKINERFETFR